MPDRACWELDALGHHDAAARVSRLRAFSAGTTACIEHMLDARDRGEPVGVFLSAFQSEFNSVKDEEFVRFEEELPASRVALLSLRPGPVLPRSRHAVAVAYFQDLL